MTVDESALFVYLAFLELGELPEFCIPFDGLHMNPVQFPLQALATRPQQLFLHKLTQFLALNIHIKPHEAWPKIFNETLNASDWRNGDMDSTDHRSHSRGWHTCAWDAP